MTKEMIANRKRGIMFQIEKLDADLKVYAENYKRTGDETEKEFAEMVIDQKKSLMQMYGKLEEMELNAE